MDRSELLICIDIGHNVNGDNGAEYDGGLSENACAKQIGEKLYALLEKWGYKVMYSFSAEDKAAVEAIKAQEDAKSASERDTTKPMYESLRRRCLNSNANLASLFVAIHLNANGDVAEASKGRGSGIYVKTNDEKVLANMILNQICNQHYELGSTEFSDGVAMIGKPYKNNGVKSGENLYVLRNTFCPAILIEGLFVDNALDYGLYKDEKPYINHEHTTLEEGVAYVNENVLSYNFLAYSIARGIEDYVRGNYLQPFEPKNCDSYEATPINYVCYTEAKKDTKIEGVIHKNDAKENIYGGRLMSLLTNERDEFGSDMTVGYMAFKNIDAVQASYVSIMKPSDVQLGHIKNLANLGESTEVKGEKAIIFKLRGKCNVYRSDGSPYCTLGEGDIVGLYQERTNTLYEPVYSTPTYASYAYAKGPIVCEPSKPNWIKIQFAIKNGTQFESLYNQYNGDNYAWIETNLGAAYNLSDFVLELNV